MVSRTVDFEPEIVAFGHVGFEAERVWLRRTAASEAEKPKRGPR